MLRYPRLILLLKHQCSLTLTEAIGCVNGITSEAVNHYGGRDKCITDAIASRHRLYKLYNGPLEYWFTKRDRTTLREVGL